MVARVGGYYVEPFFREIGVTQGEPLLPNIFNVVVEELVRHWEYLVEEGYRYNDGDNSSGNEAAHPLPPPGIPSGVPILPPTR